MKKPTWAEEYDGHEAVDNKPLTEEDLKKVEELRRKIAESNDKKGE